MKCTGFLSPLMLGAALTLALASSPLLAQADNGKDQTRWKTSGGRQESGQQGSGQRQAKGQNRQGQNEQGRGSAGERERYHRDYRERDRNEHRGREHEHHEYGRRERDGDRDGVYRSRFDEREIREIFRSRRESLHHDDRDSLPPGIRMNLERGKPLPPGIATKFDERVRRDLPTYDGYEWRRVGTDAVLVDPTNDIIHEVIHDILR